MPTNNEEQYTNPYYAQDVKYSDEEKKTSSENNDGVFNSVAVGANNQCIRMDKRGLWVGHREFNYAAFKVDINGNVTATSIELIGGVIRYGKANFTDNTNGFYIGPEGINFGTASKYFKYTLASSSMVIKGTINADDGTIGGFTITSNKLYATTTGEIASSNDAVPAAKLYNGGLSVKIEGGTGLSLVGSDGATRGYFFEGFDTNQGVGIYSNGSFTFQLGAGGGFYITSNHNGVDYLGSPSYKWAGMYMTSTVGSNQSAGGVGGGNTITSDADGSVGMHSHNVPNHSHSLLFNYITLNINGTNYKLLTV
jgi:hypothetical protein